MIELFLTKEEFKEIRAVYIQLLDSDLPCLLNKLNEVFFRTGLPLPNSIQLTNKEFVELFGVFMDKCADKNKEIPLTLKKMAIHPELPKILFETGNIKESSIPKLAALQEKWKKNGERTQSGIR